MASNNLQKAKKAKNDEFYTQLSDIEKELLHYRDQFRGKIIFCNCDDPEESNFWLYFKLNFEFLGIKKLISTHYEQNIPSYKLEMYSEDKTDKTILKGNGDFRSDECIEVLKESDMVVTNPPFSLYREYVAQLIKYDKKFLIVGSQNAIIYKEVFPLLKNNKMWLGYKSGGYKFEVPLDYNIGKIIIEDNKHFIKLGNIAWFTNMEVSKRNEDIILFREYSEEMYPKYDNYDAINVDKVKDIPKDYYGVMGVPITFMSKYNPEQFEILGMTKPPICYNNDDLAKRNKTYKNVKQYNETNKVSCGNKVNDGAVLQVQLKPTKTYYVENENKVFLIALYARILIRRSK